MRVVPTAAEGLTAMSSHRRLAHRRRSIRLTPARDLTVCNRYLPWDGLDVSYVICNFFFIIINKVVIIMIIIHKYLYFSIIKLSVIL